MQCLQKQYSIHIHCTCVCIMYSYYASDIRVKVLDFDPRFQPLPWRIQPWLLGAVSFHH